MIIELAIKRAIKAGFKPSYDSLDSFILDDPKHWDESLVCRSLLDPAFWQSLGKALGWKQVYERCLNDGSKSQAREWVYQWHRFIDHLVQGKDAESFFHSL